ncbi:hypothetical protein DSO57_1008442 [Entomophthora muscae]|uniref:Uncharacterized protein n=1 Tax=Entomophthora muscae TaxID=34485 RepID=A0ACC2T760_9FUNG|nr:hypothetical protein DSO57_1008442 [Entomophthora muscae]
MKNIPVLNLQYVFKLAPIFWWALPTSVRNIPDINHVGNSILATIGPTGQSNKWQQFPLIRETAAKQEEQ